MKNSHFVIQCHQLPTDFVFVSDELPFHEFIRGIPLPKKKKKASNYVLTFWSRVRSGQSGAKPAIQILAKCSVFSFLLSQYAREKRESERPSELLTP